MNIEGPYHQRRTANAAAGNPTYFFGGSTMWGTGVRDADTIPSIFATSTNTYSENFGESAYTAHQSLVLLL